MSSSQKSRIVQFPAPVAQKPRRKKKRLPVTLFLFCAIIAYFSYTFVVQAFEMRDVLAQEQVLNDKYKALSEDAKGLNSEIALLHTDEYIERLARERLGLVRPQDTILIPMYLAPKP